MGAHEWPPTRPLVELLESEPWRFEYDQAIRLIEMLLEPEADLGEGADPRREGVRLTGEMDFAFPPSLVRGAEFRRNRFGKIKGVRLKLAVLALAGVLGPLPLAFTDMLMDRRVGRDTAMRDFLDLFNHRLMSILLKTRSRARIRSQWRDPLSHPQAGYLFAVAGFGTDGTRGRLGITDGVLLRQAALFGSRPSTTSGLEATLSGLFGLSVRVRPFQGRWFDVDPSDRTRIGGPGRGRNNALGRDTGVGTKAYDPSGGFLLELETKDQELFDAFMPGGSAFQAVSSITRAYVGQGVEFGLQITGHFARRRPPRLRVADQLRLGWTARAMCADDLDSDAPISTTIKIQNVP